MAYVNFYYKDVGKMWAKIKGGLLRFFRT